MSFRRSGSSSGNNEDLHGNAPDRSSAALLLVDLINDLEFPGNEYLVSRSTALARSIANLKQRCRQAGIPAIYVNDNRGRWRSDFHAVLKHCLQPRRAGHEMVRRLQPRKDDYVVLKPKHSAFYATPLETLLDYIGVRTVILTGITTNACVMITAGALYVRDYRVLVPPDCVVGLSEAEQLKALDLMTKNFGADTRPSDELAIAELLK